MSETDFDETQDDEHAPEWARNLRKEFKAATKERDAALAELATLKRDKAFDDAGIPADKAGALLRKAYDGELDAEAIKAAAVEYGIIDTPSPEPSVPADELAAHERMSETAGISEPPADLIQKLQGAKSESEARAILASAGALAE